MRHQQTPTAIDNVLIDLGFDDAQELSAKAALALKLNQLIEHKKLTQAQAATRTGLAQPKISLIRHYKLQNISLERLMHALASLGQHVHINIQPATSGHAAGISVQS
jgi:predicted XRE-type DNA-binding protein